MFDRLETWLIIALLLWAACCWLDERICKACKRHKHREKERKRMKSELKKKDEELEELKLQHKRDYVMDVYARDLRIDELERENAKLKKEVKRLETMLAQKWNEAHRCSER